MRAQEKAAIFLHFIYPLAGNRKTGQASKTQGVEGRVWSSLLTLAIVCGCEEEYPKKGEVKIASRVCKLKIRPHFLGLVNVRGRQGALFLRIQDLMFSTESR